MKHLKPRVSDSVKAALITLGAGIVVFVLFSVYEVFVAIETPVIKEDWIERWIKETDSDIKRLEELHMKPCPEECK